MRKTIFVIVLGSAAAVATAQQQSPPKEPDKDAQTRIRTDKAAGGLGEVKPEDKAGADLGAGPHKQFKPSGAARRQRDEGSSEPQAGRGATR